jgi:hypothetical protein
VDNTFLLVLFGIVIGVLGVGLITIVYVSIKSLTIITEIVSLLKTVYISTNKIEQMSQATMQASENFVDALSNVTNEYQQKPNDNIMFKMFTTQDGKHTSSTLDGLIEKIKKDGQYKEITENDINELRKLFEDNSDEDDSDDEPNEPWKGTNDTKR